MNAQKMTRTNLYAVLTLSPILLLSACKPVDWAKEKLGIKPAEYEKNEPATAAVAASGDWIVKVDGQVKVHAQRFEKEFEELLEENQQLKQMRPLMPNLEKDFAKGLGNQEVISRYIQDKKIDQKPEYLAKKERYEKAIAQRLNIEFFAESFEDAKISDAELKKFYEENKDTMQGIMISSGGISTIGVSFDSKPAAEEFLKKAKAQGKNVDLEKLAKAEGLQEKLQDFGLVSPKSFAMDASLRSKVMGMKTFPSTQMFAGKDKVFWVVHAKEKLETTYQPFEKIKDGLRTVAMQQEKAKKLEKEIEKLSKSYNVQINDDYFTKKMGSNSSQKAGSQEVTQDQLIEALSRATQEMPEEKTK